MNNEPSYFGLTNDHTWLSVDEEYYKKLKPTHRMKCYTHPSEHDLGIAEAIGFDKGYQAAMEKTLTPLTEDECEEIINKHDWFSKSWREMAKEIHDAILKKAQNK